MIQSQQCYLHVFILIFCEERNTVRATAEVGLFLLIPSSSTGNDKSTEQQQYGSKPQLLPLSQFPEGQKEFSSQLKVTVLHTERAKLCEMRQEKMN